MDKHRKLLHDHQILAMSVALKECDFLEVYFTFSDTASD